ncbi:MAG: FmdB family transcriptional regulator [Treponema sp.]|nr:FmdB family transcriptional regulator [Treponema sp.]MCL2250441.1 FmdB family transcriptional regulator [Treponema sp.]
MPTYEYECKSCSHNFEVFQSMSEPPLTICPECGKEIRRLIFGGTGVIFKGSGFYVTDKGKSSKAGTKTPSKKTDSAAQTDSACSACPANEAGKCPSAQTEPRAGESSSSEKAKPESKSA